MDKRPTLCVIGAGGMGKVYLGVQPAIGSRVAERGRALLAKGCGALGEIVRAAQLDVLRRQTPAQFVHRQ